jgi:hypothetical protein
MRLFRVMMANGQALTDYQPHGYPGSLVLFQTRALRQRLPQDPTAGWGKYVRGGVSRHDIPRPSHELAAGPAGCRCGRKDAAGSAGVSIQPAMNLCNQHLKWILVQ